MPNVLVLGIGELVGPDGLLHLWPDRFSGRRVGEFSLRTFGWTPGLDHRFPRATPLAAIVERVTAEGFRPDLVLLFSAEWLELPPRVEACSVPTVLVVQDWDYWILHTRFAAQACDLTIAQGEESAATLRRLGASRVASCQFFGTLAPPAFDATARDVDVFFPGHLDDLRDRERSRWAVRLARLGRRLRVVVPGDYLSRSDYFRLLGRSKLVFAHHRRGELTARFFDALAAGALPLDAGATPARLLGHLPYGRFADADFEDTVTALVADPAALSRRVETCRAAVRERFGSERCFLDLLRCAATVLDETPRRRPALDLAPADLHLGAAAAAYVGSQRSNLAPDGRNPDALALAEAECEAAVLAAPGPRSWTSLAAVLVSRRVRGVGDDVLARVVDLLTRALGAEPCYAAAHLVAWRLLVGVGHAAEARAHADAAMRLLADDPATLDPACLLPDGAIEPSVATECQRALLDHCLEGGTARLARLATVALLLWRAESEPPDVALATIAPAVDDSPAALLRAARLAGSLRDHGQRSALLRRATALLPTNGEVRLALIEALLAAGDAHRAREAVVETRLLARSLASLTGCVPRLAELERRLARTPGERPSAELR